MSGWRAASVLLVLLAACSRDIRPPPRLIDDTRLVILEPVDADAVMRRWLGELREQYPAAIWMPMEQWPAALDAATEERRILIIPDSARVSVEALPRIEALLGGGGQAVFIGAEPFADVLVDDQGERVPWSVYQDRLLAAAQPVADLSDIQLWRHEQCSGERRSVVRAAVNVPWPGVQVEPDTLYGWDHMALPESPPPLSEEPFGAVATYLRGGRNTSRLVLRVREDDGAEWVSVLPVRGEWEPRILFDADWLDPGRTLDWARVAEVTVGLDIQRAPQHAGSHLYGVTDFRLIPRDRLLPAPPALAMPFIQDPAWRSRMDALTVQGLRSDARWRARAEGAGIVWQNPAMRTPEKGRWLPLFVAKDRAGDAQGDVAGLFLRNQAGGPPEQWAWIGLDVTRRTRAAVSGMLNEALFFLQRGRFLLSAEIPQHLYEQGESFTVSARVIGLNPEVLTVRVSAELIDESDQIVRRVVSAPFDLGANEISQEMSLNLGVVPAVEEGARGYTIEIGLEEVGGRSRRFDRVKRPIQVLGSRPAPPREVRVRALAGRLVSGRIPLFFVGVDYDPGLVRQPDTAWLEARHFPAAQVARDMADLRAAGINAIRIPYTDIQQARQVRHVIELARQQALWVHLSLPDWWEWSREPEGLAPYLDALHVAEDVRVVSLDLTPPLSVALEGRAETGLLDQAWTDWLTTYLGSVEGAERLWGAWLRFDSGLAYFPAAEELAVVPEESALWAHIARFLADWWSQELGRAATQIRGSGHRQLLTARWDAGQADLRLLQRHQAPFLAEAAAVHLDYVTIVPMHVVGGQQALGGEAFKAAYMRGMTYGKPVVWGPLATPVGSAPVANDYALQEEMITAFYRLAMGTQASGGWLRHYRPISHESWSYDEGLIDSSGRRRPAIRALRQVVNLLRGYRMPPIQWSDREMDYEMTSNPWASAQANWSHVYEEELARPRIGEIRPRDFMVWSMDVGPERLGGLAGGAFANLHAEWGALQVDAEDRSREFGATVRMGTRQTLRAEWINRGPTRWSASQHRQDGTVWLSIESAGRATQYLEVRAVPPGGSVQIEWRPVDPGLYTLRGYWLGRGFFGDALTVAVEESMLNDGNSF